MKTILYPSYPSYAKGKYDSFCLMKFFKKKEHRDYFLSGKLFMRQHTSFALEEFGSGISDVTEGAEVVALQRNPNMFFNIQFALKEDGTYVEITETKEKPENYRENQAFISYPYINQKRNIFCMYTLWCNISKACLNPIDADSMASFGEYGVIIPDYCAFLNVVAEAVNAQESIKNVQCGFVEYIPPSKMTNVMEMTPFLKPAEGYQYQNEFRICAETDNTDILELQLNRDLHDITIPIKLHDFAHSVFLRDGRLLYKADIEDDRCM